MADFLTDVETLRARAREHIEKGPITAAYGADREPCRRGVERGARD